MVAMGPAGKPRSPWDVLYKRCSPKDKTDKTGKIIALVQAHKALPDGGSEWYAVSPGFDVLVVRFEHGKRWQWKCNHPFPVLAQVTGACYIYISIKPPWAKTKVSGVIYPDVLIRTLSGVVAAAEVTQWPGSMVHPL